MDMDNGLCARQPGETEGIHGVARTIRAVDDANSSTANVRGQREAIERERDRRAGFAPDGRAAAVPEPRGERRRPQADIGDLSEVRE